MASKADCDSAEFQHDLQSEPTVATENAEARAYWLDRQLIQWPGVLGSEQFRLYYSSRNQLLPPVGSKVTGYDGAVSLSLEYTPLPLEIARRFHFVAQGIVLRVPSQVVPKVGWLLQQQVILVQQDSQGRVIQVTQLQAAGALDDLYSNASSLNDLGVTLFGQRPMTKFKLWAPTAKAVALCIYNSGSSNAIKIASLARQNASGIWEQHFPENMTGKYYQYLVDVFIPGKGLIRNRVTDPYSVSLTTNSKRSYITSYDDPLTLPQGWNKAVLPKQLAHQTDMLIYELHVRDFSANDQSVPEAYRGKYLAFTQTASKGMQHLAGLAKSGMTDVHLLPVFDFASVPEVGCVTPAIHSDVEASSMLPQQLVVEHADNDCFNWGYDPLHYNAPEGSYATDPSDGAVRMLEFRKMIMALHGIGLRVGMDVVYNHTFASGQKETSVLDRIVPGYYHRLNERGEVEHSTCCENTATENRMMGKLLIDSVMSWARHYNIDSFRFDLMAHQPRSVIEELKHKLEEELKRPIYLIGEGWNFGEIANGSRFVQASQLSLNGSGIGTFNDRLRDAVRGGSSSDSGSALVDRKGYINGLADGEQNSIQLKQAADMVRAGLAGSLRHVRLTTYEGSDQSLENLDYNGQPAGYVSEPSEVVNYVENHDNQTLFDINAYKLPVNTSLVDRVRVQTLATAITAFSQGVAYFHAGQDMLRSKSMDSNSCNSGDWFNRLDWSFQDNYFATGLPPQKDNEMNYPIIQPLLNNPGIKPKVDDIQLAHNMFLDLISVRASSSLFRMASAEDIKQRLRFDNVGPNQNGNVIAVHLDGRHYPGAHFQSILYFINVAKTPQVIQLPEEKGQSYVLHPVFQNKIAADKRIAEQAIYDSVNGQFSLPARSAVVFVVP